MRFTTMPKMDAICQQVRDAWREQVSPGDWRPLVDEDSLTHVARLVHAETVEQRQEGRRP